MKMAEFYNVLSKLKHKWAINDHGYCQYIRTYTKDGTEMCPVTAVAYKVTGKLYTEGHYDQAGKAINIRRRSIEAIVNAADTVSKQYRRTRLKLLRTLKLQKK